MDAKIRSTGANFIALAGFMRLLTDGFIHAWRDRMINIHPALLPALKGLHTHERAIRRGLKLHGCTVHFVRPEMDTGPIIAQAAVPVLAGDTPDQLADRVLAAEHRLYPQALRLIAAGKVRVEGEIVVIEDAGDPAALLINPALS
jgi:phosphoribosylglycinamide formyltransferase-1